MVLSKILPQEKKCTFGQGNAFFEKAIWTENHGWDDIVSGFCSSFEKVHEVKLENKKGGIELVYDVNVNENAYELRVSDGGMQIYASANEGILYGLSSALQLASVSGNKLSAPVLHINDYPDKDYRGLMIDLGHTWNSAKSIFKYIDICFLFKIKYLHLHFMDNVVYSLPSKAFPKLAIPGKSYTFEEIAAFCEYAKKRGVVIIPEIELPGHASALVAAYPEIFANTLDSELEYYRPDLGEKKDGSDVICVGSDKTMAALETIVDEICDMFPDSPYIHIGGDEVNHYVWKACPCCRKYIKDNGLADENELYSEFIGRMAKMVLAKGRTPIVWEGFPKESAHHVPKETIVIAWESLYHLAYDLLDEGYKIINASWKPLYIVKRISTKWNPYDIMAWNMYRWENHFDQSEATLNPVQVTPTDRVLGAQVSVWGTNYEHDVGFIIDNLAALAERTWNEKRRYTDEQFTGCHSKAVTVASKLIADK